MNYKDKENIVDYNEKLQEVTTVKMMRNRKTNNYQGRIQKVSKSAKISKILQAKITVTLIVTS